MPTFYKGCKRQTIQTYPNIWVLVAIFLCVAKALHFSQCNISEECTWQQSVESFGAHPDWSHCNVSCQKRLQKKCYKMLQAFHNCLWILQQTDICWLVSRQNHKPAPKLFCLSRTGSRSCLGGGCTSNCALNPANQKLFAEHLSSVCPLRAAWSCNSTCAMQICWNVSKYCMSKYVELQKGWRTSLTSPKLWTALPRRLTAVNQIAELRIGLVVPQHAHEKETRIQHPTTQININKQEYLEGLTILFFHKGTTKPIWMQSQDVSSHPCHSCHGQGAITEAATILVVGALPLPRPQRENMDAYGRMQLARLPSIVQICSKGRTKHSGLLHCFGVGISADNYTPITHLCVYIIVHNITIHMHMYRTCCWASSPSLQLKADNTRATEKQWMERSDLLHH